MEEQIYIMGLTSEEAEIKKNNGQNNIQIKVASKTIGQIIASNVFTYLNLIIYSLALLLIIINEYMNAIFIFTTLFNMFVGIVQETRIKLAIDKLSVINQAKVKVVRDGEEKEVNIEDVVLDDIVYLNTGDQICSDAIVIKGTDLTVNESLLTGEADSITKRADDEVLSGSFVTTGFGYVKVCRVGEDNYASKIMLEAKKYKKSYSELLFYLNKIIKTIGIFIIPLGTLLFLSSYARSEELIKSIVTSVAGITGMIPQGLVVLSNVSFALGVIKMAKHKAFLKSLPSIETFSRVNVICFDKTGTLTEGNPYVDTVDYIANRKRVVSAISNINSSLPKGNPTAEALALHFGNSINYVSIDVLPFSSERKISAVSFKKHGTFILGAYEFIFKGKKTGYEEKIESYLKKGYRVIVLAHTNKNLDEQIFDDCELEAIIVLRDRIKKDAKRIINYLKKEKIEIKVISGDSPLTTSMIASLCEIDNTDKYIDMSSVVNPDFEELVMNYTIFGRTTPHQKKELIMALKRLGKVTAMTGDGVNDILALKESDFSIAMANGSEATKNVAEVVLMDSNFSSFPKILNESRKIINNITNLATCYITKTMYSFLLVVLFIFLPSPFPFEPLQFSIISSTTIGIPTFFFMFTPCEKMPKGNFLRTVILKSLPFALTIVFNILAITIFGTVLKSSQTQITTLCLISTEMIALTLVYYVSRPMTKPKRIFNTALAIAFALILIVFKDALQTDLRFNLITFLSLSLAILSSYILIKSHKIDL